MTIYEWQSQAETQLNAAGISTARLDVFVLLADQTGHDKAWLLSHSDNVLQGSDIKILNTKIVQRTQHVPLAYIRGHAEFYGREFAVTEHTLVPRPETETLIDMLKRVRNMEADVATFQVERRGRKPVKKQYKCEKQEPASSLVRTPDGYKVVWQKPQRPAHHQPKPPIAGQSLRYHDERLHIYDIGTGSGAIAITAKLEIPGAAITAIDIDEACLTVARRNATQLGADVAFRHGDLAEPILASEQQADTLHIVLANLPYVPEDFHINTAATHEPPHAIFGGSDGLDLYRRMFSQLDSGLQPQYVITESLPQSHTELITIAKAAGYGLTRTDDFIQLFERI